MPLPILLLYDLSVKMLGCQWIGWPAGPTQCTLKIVGQGPRGYGRCISICSIMVKMCHKTTMANDRLVV